MRELDQRAMELQLAEEECRRNINVATTDYNNALVGCLSNQNTIDTFYHLSHFYTGRI